MGSRLGTTARMNQARCVYRAQRHPAANQNRRLNQSPINALIDLEITGRLRCQIPGWLNSNTLARQRITTVAPQGWPACRGDVWGFGVDPDVLQYLA